MRYNTTEVHVKRIDRAVERRTFQAICSVNHLTPASEAAMENCLLPDDKKISVPSIAETIEENSPGYEPPQSEPTWEQERDEEDVRPDWETVKGPTKAALQAIEAEPTIHALLAKSIR